MALVDSRLLLSEAQAVTTSTVATTNHIDLESDRDIGVGRPLYLVVHVIVALTDDYVFNLQTDSDDGFATDIETIASITLAEGLAAGQKRYIAIPNRNLRYLRGQYVPENADGGGTFTAYLTDQKPQDYQSYPDNVPV